MPATPPFALTRDRVVAHRWTVLQSPAVLGTGVRDYPPGRTAGVALRVRGVDAAGTVLVHGVRGALHVHRGKDRGLYAAALRVDDPGDLAKEQFGTFLDDLREQSLAFGDALDEVAEAMRAVTADGAPRTKGELSGALIPLVDARLRPWCEGCGAAHVHDALFRWATLQADLVVEGDHYRPGPPCARPDAAAARAEVVRRFLALHGPARPAHLAGWLALSPGGARRWWPDDLVRVTVEGRRAEVLPGDLAALRTAEPTGDVRLLPPYDPLTEIGDRELLVPDRDRRRRVWRAAGNPGVVAAGGEIVGTWRRRAGIADTELWIPVDPEALRAATNLLG